MALTLAEAAKLTNDVLLRGVVETIVLESTMLQRLPFMTVRGTAITFNRENVNADVTFFNVGDAWTEATPTFTQITEALKILGTDADVDNFLQQTYANPNDLEAEVLALRAKKVGHKFADTAIVGDTAVDAKSFDGLRKRIGTGSRSITIGANGGALTLDFMDQLIDMVKPGRPDVLVMSKRSRRKLSSLRRASGNLLETDRNDFGLRATFYDGIEISVDEFQPDTEVEGTSGAVCSSIYALKFGDEGVMGLQGSDGIQTEDIGELETKDATRWRVKWYASMTIKSELGVARLRGITAA
jgi:hypothetical protein